MPPGSVLLFWSIIIYHRSIMIYFDRHVIFSFRYAIWMVDHNWLAVDHDLPFSCTTSRSIMIYLDRHVIFYFLYTLCTVDHTWQTVDLDLPFMHFFGKKSLFSVRYGPWTVDRNLPCPPKVDLFHQKVETSSRCCPTICAISLAKFHIFVHKFSLTRFSPKRV